jgi:ABC transporter DrrB family efflux protein
VTSGPAAPVRLRGVCKRYGSTTAVSDLDLEVQSAEVLALLGPNGAGKTTTVEMCEGFIRPDAGSIEILGLNPVTDNAKVRERIGVMLQGGGAYPAAQAGEMLNLVASYSADPLDPQWLMETLGLTEAAKTTYRRLSGGQQQRLALACAVVGRPELVFLDEPTAGMDAHARIVVWELIDALRRDGVTVVLTTHQLTEAEELADRLVIIDRGVAVASGTPAELMNRGAENQLRFRAPRMLDLSLLISALPEGYKASEPSPGDGDRVVREAQCAGERHAGGAAQPRGCVPRSDGAGVAVVTNRFASGTFTPDPRPATVPKMLAAQFALELKLLLRNGEQLLLTLFIPITLLVGLTLLPLGSFGPNRAATFVPAIMSLAVISTAFTGQAIAVAFDRRYGALKRIGATALPVWGIIAGKSLAVVTVVFLQSIVLGSIGFALGWRPHIVGLMLGAAIIALGTAGFAAMGLLVGGTLRAEIVLAIANLLWFVFAGLGALTLEGQAVPEAGRWAARLTPSGALTEALTQAMSLSVDWFGIAVLAAWGVVSAVCALRWFRFT